MRDIIIENLLKHGWIPNIEYLNEEYSSWYWIVNKYADEKGRFCTENNDGSVEYSKYNYLTSPNKKFAITIKENTITLHQAEKKYEKILTLNISDIILDESGLKSGMILMLYNE